mmetsp:Transcript_24789/g.37789  ORF Transcript_24789/g.37789 Transcript_24789/m.37789 type:complete len:152 (+) Transcript_24789:160-615(+)
MSFSSSPAACHGLESRTRHCSPPTAAFKGVADRVNGVRGRTSMRHFSQEVANCLDDVDFGVPKLKDVEDGLPRPFNAGKIQLRRSEIKSSRKRWNGDKAAQASCTTGASELLCGALRAEQPNVATIVTRSQSAKMLSQAGCGSIVDKRTRR